MKTTTRIVAGTLLVGLLATGNAWGQGAPAQGAAPAQPAAPAPVVTEASRREARALGEKLGWESQVRGIINTLRTAIYSQPLVAALPGAMIFMVSICFNLLSDGLRSAMDVKL
jgi:hypothetical protein